MVLIQKNLITPFQLKQTLIENSITQAQLGLDFGVSKQIVNQWCNSSISAPWQRLVIQYFMNKSIDIVKDA